MERTRATATVTWDLDPIPGWNHEPGDVISFLSRDLNERMGHYNPEVKLVKEDDEDITIGPIMYVNVYRIARCYGGPEEGGWYYDVGEPVASIPVGLTNSERETLHEQFVRDNDLQADSWWPVDDYEEFIQSAVREKARAVFERTEKQFPYTRNRWSVLGGDDHDVTIENEFAQPFPKERPYYE